MSASIQRMPCLAAMSPDSVARQCAVSAEAVEPQPPATILTARNCAAAEMPDPPISSGRFAPGIPASASTHSWS
ncbi:hypothetical protein [Roseovarius sp. SYSU LYC5161]|uniref:hypothetical protein n=1 Tax=Roseovarius halophilus (ex Wu et al. 2025) TaxID=3376060 RepID=UPI00399B27AB